MSAAVETLVFTAFLQWPGAEGFLNRYAGIGGIDGSDTASEEGLARVASVLVVEEQPGTREWLTRVLLVDGHGPVEGCAAAEALERAARLHPDLVVAGTRLPDVDGLEVVQRLREDSGLEGIPVVLLSDGCPGQVLEMVASADGAVFVVHGPADEGRVREAVKVALSLAHGLGRIDGGPARGSGRGTPSTSRGGEGGGLFREVFECAPDSLVLAEAGRVRHANAVAERTFGYDEGELVGRATCDLLPDLSRAWDSALGTVAGTDPARVRLELQACRKGGESFPVSVRLSHFRAEGCEWQVLVVHDLTERRQLELQVGSALRQEAMRRLAGGLAHEFNNMLTVVTGYAAIAQDLVNPRHPVHQPLEEVLAASERAARVTRRLLAFSRRQVQCLETLDVNRVLCAIEETLRDIGDGKVALHMELAGDLGLVRADASQLEEVFVDLAVHARELMPEGGTLCIRTMNLLNERALPLGEAGSEEELPIGYYVVVEVSDTGVPLEAGRRATLFEPFSTPLAEGRGLGLAATHGLVRQNGGRMAATGTRPLGTCFRVYLPRLDLPERGREASSPLPGVRSGGGETILLVEDEDSVRALVGHLLRGWGYEVLQAGNGPQALSTSAGYDGPIHLVLSDVVMPQMNGVELTERLLAQRPAVKVLYMSGYSDDRLPPSSRFLAKPFTPLALAAKVREALEGG